MTISVIEMIPIRIFVSISISLVGILLVPSLTTTTDTLDRPAREKEGEVIRQRSHHDAGEEERSRHHDHGHPSKDVTERGEVRLEHGARQQKRGARPESLDGRAVQFLRDDGQSHAYRRAVQCHHQGQDGQGDESHDKTGGHFEIRRCRAVIVVIRLALF